MPYHSIAPLFPSGNLLISPSILSRGLQYIPLLKRHLAGDWGEVSGYDRDCNDRSLDESDDLLSQYTTSDKYQATHLVTIVTSADRSYTVIFLAGDSEN